VRDHSSLVASTIIAFCGNPKCSLDSPVLGFCYLPQQREEKDNPTDLVDSGQFNLTGC
jgi:hypothetical protein